MQADLKWFCLRGGRGRSLLLAAAAAVQKLCWISCGRSIHTEPSQQVVCSTTGGDQEVCTCATDVTAGWASSASSSSHLDWVQVGCHDDLVQGSCQLRGQLGFLFLPLRSGVELQPRPREEVVDHCHTVVLTWMKSEEVHVRSVPAEAAGTFASPTNAAIWAAVRPTEFTGSVSAPSSNIMDVMSVFPGRGETGSTLVTNTIT